MLEFVVCVMVNWLNYNVKESVLNMRETVSNKVNGDHSIITVLYRYIQ